MVTITKCTEVTDEVVKAMNRLIRQLSSSNPPPTRAQIEEIVASPATTLFLARRSRSASRADHVDTEGETRDFRKDGEILGTLTLVAFRIPTGVRARIEDVVVDETVRGRRVGEMLSSVALDEARALGAVNVDLTSRPSRRAANRLYRRMGFEQRESNVYRFKL